MDRYVIWVACSVVALSVATIYLGSKNLMMGVAFGFAAVSMVYGISGFGVVHDLRMRFVGFAVFPIFLGVVGFLWFGSGSSLLSLAFLVGGLVCGIGLAGLWVRWVRQPVPPELQDRRIQRKA